MIQYPTCLLIIRLMLEKMVPLKEIDLIYCQDRGICPFYDSDLFAFVLKSFLLSLIVSLCVYMFFFLIE